MSQRREGSGVSDYSSLFAWISLAIGFICTAFRIECDGVMTIKPTKRGLRGQVAVITGGGRGIGREVARNLAASGATVVVTARTVSQLEETCSLITSDGGICTAVPVDVQDEAGIKAAFREIERSHGSGPYRTDAAHPRAP